MKTFTRRTVLAATGLAVLALSGGAALAHHGWSWTSGGNIELIGIVRKARLGMPHGVLTVDAEGEMWTVEVGQPWRNARAGLTDADLAPGTELTIIGEPAADPSERKLKAERIMIAGKLYDLYPGRS